MLVLVLVLCSRRCWLVEPEARSQEESARQSTGWSRRARRDACLQTKEIPNVTTASPREEFSDALTGRA